MNVKALIAEFVGVFALCFVGIGSIVAAKAGGGLMIPALAHGLVIACFASAASVSGGHLNPCVSVAMLVTGRQKAPDAVAYILAQIAGAIVASLALGAVFAHATLGDVGYGVPALGEGISQSGGIITEFILTFFLVWVIFGTAVDSRGPKMGALFIGLTVTLDILMGGPVTGAAMNFARYLGPAIVFGKLDQVAVYLVGTFGGAIAAGLLYHHAILKNTSDPA